MKTVSWYLHSLVCFDFDTITVIDKSGSIITSHGRRVILDDFGAHKVHTSVMANNALMLYLA